MKILFLSRQVLIRLEPLLEEVLDRLHIMIRRSFNLFDTLRILYRKVGENFVHEGLLRRDFLDSRCILRHNALVEECLEPVKLYVDTEAHQGVLGEIRPQ